MSLSWRNLDLFSDLKVILIELIKKSNEKIDYYGIHDNSMNSERLVDCKLLSEGKKIEYQHS